MSKRTGKKSAKRKTSAQTANEKLRADRPKLTLLQRVVRTLPLAALAIVFTFILSRSGVFAELETSILDTQMRLNMPQTESPVVIVDIGQEDFEEIFNSKTRPLDPAGLERLANAIAAGNPCAVGVDIDTSFDQFRNFSITDSMSNFVWSRSGSVPESAKEKPVPLRVLGRDEAALNSRSGLPLLGDSEKKITRFYARQIETTDGPLPSLGWRLFEEARSRNCPGLSFPNLKQEPGSLIIDYSRGAEGKGRIKIPAKFLLSMSESEEWAVNDLIRGKIVLIGGSYLNEDRYDTPLGVMTGSEIHANVVETELRGGGVRPPGLATIILLQIFDGFLLLGLYQVYAWRKAALLSIPLILAFSLACSFATYYSFSYWLLFLPVMLGVAITQLFDEAKDFFKNRYKREIREGYREISGHEPEEH